MFKLWSDMKSQAKESLQPDLGLINWNDLNGGHKSKIWQYMEYYFFDRNIKTKTDSFSGSCTKYYSFSGDITNREIKQNSIIVTINELNERYKVQSYGKAYLDQATLNSACDDFSRIILNEDEDVVMETLSIFAKNLYEISKKKEYIYKKEGEGEEDFKIREINGRYYYFDKFANRLNEVCLQFGIRYHLTRDGFVPRQEDKIIEDVYEPVIKILSNPKWKAVNDSLADAFCEYRKNTSLGYSNTVTNAISSIQAFLQILVNGSVGKGDISKLIPQGQKTGVIPKDFFSIKIFENMEAIFARERQETSTAHPKKQYATEKNARLILNLAMIFLQHCLESAPD